MKSDLQHNSVSIPKVFKQCLGFTLLEIVLVLGLMTLLAGMSIFHVDGLFRSWSHAGPEQQLQTILREVRQLARENNAITDFYYSESDRTFHAIHSHSTATQTWQLQNVAPGFRVKFYPAEPLIEPTSTPRPSYDLPLDRLRFDANGMTHWTVIEWSDGSKRPVLRLIDPFTLDFSEI